MTTFTLGGGWRAFVPLEDANLSTMSTVEHDREEHRRSRGLWMAWGRQSVGKPLDDSACVQQNDECWLST
jgi:hypothetical protein